MKPHPRNPNRMADDAKARLAKSLSYFGDLGGIVVNRRNGMLVGGHQRTAVMRDGKLTVTERLDKPERDGTVARGYIEHTGSRYAYREVDWDERKHEAAMVAANRHGRVGEDDPAILKDLLLELDAGDLDIDLTGFSEDDIEKIVTATGNLPPVDERMELQPYEHYDYLLVLATDVRDWEALCESIGVKRCVSRSIKKAVKIGLGRCISAKRVLEVLRAKI